MKWASIAVNVLEYLKKNKKIGHGRVISKYGKFQSFSGSYYTYQSLQVSRLLFLNISKIRTTFQTYAIIQQLR